MSEAARAALVRIADVLFPPGDMPSASAADPDGRLLDIALAARPDLATSLDGVLARAATENPVALVARLRMEDPRAFVAVATVAAGAYYMSPEVMNRIGYPGQKPTWPGSMESEHDLDDGILDPVIERGPFYRPTPTSRPPG